MEKEAEVQTHVVIHDIRNQLGNIYLAVEGIRSELTEPNDDLAIYTDIIQSCCKQVEKILGTLKQNC